MLNITLENPICLISLLKRMLYVVDQLAVLDFTVRKIDLANSKGVILVDM